MKKEEWETEKKHLDETKNIIQESIDQKNVSIEDYKNIITENKKFLWDNKNDYKDFELYSSMNEEDQQVDIINANIKKVYKLYRSLETPYFSRIDFKQNGKTNSFYIGLTGIDKDYTPLVYDWRTNVANLYYNYSVGPAKYETPEGTQTGEITLKRQFVIEQGVLKSFYDSALCLRDELLEETLKSNTTEKMKNIVGTIQKEQNDIIRLSPKTSVVVEGVAGSGKTSVAMHRIAYLLYNEKSLTDKNVLIFSPSAKFSSYIENVLPELGEENVRTTTYDDLVRDITKKKSESLLEAAEDYYSKEHSINSDKLSFKYKSTIDEYIEKLWDSLHFSKKIGLKKEFLTAAMLNEMKNKVPKNLSFADKLEYLSNKICESFDIDEIKNSKKITNTLKNILSIKKDPIELYEDFAGIEFGEEIPYEDGVGLLYLHFEVNGYPEYGYIKEVIIDEAQDYSLWQISILKNIFKSATFTILGDPNQRINPYIKYDTFKSIEGIFSGSLYLKLEHAYRSSKNIIELGNKLIGTTSIAVRKTDAFPIEFKNETNIKGNLQKDIEHMKALGLQNIGIITKTEEEKSYLTKLGLDAKIEVVYATKGLEYDSCIIYTGKENEYDKDEINLFYIAITRALHALIIYNQKNMRDFVERV